MDNGAHSIIDTIREKIGKLDRAAYVKNSEMVYVAANEAYLRLLGLNGQALEGRTTGEIVNTVERLDLEDRERRCLVFGEDQIAAYSDPFGGGRFQVEMERFVADDQSIYVYGVFEPLAARPAISEEARTPDNEQGGADTGLERDWLLSLNVLDALDVGICVYDRDDRLVYVNAKVQDFYAPAIGALALGTSLRQSIEKLYLSRVQPHSVASGSSLTQKTAWIDERLQRHKVPYWSNVEEFDDGRWVKFINKRLPNGVLIGLRIDVTDMKERELLLEKTLTDVELFRTLINALPVPTFVRGEDHRVSFCNTAYAAIFGVEVEDLLGTTEVELFGNEGIALAETNRLCFENGVTIQEEQDLETRAGQHISVLTRVSRIVTENGQKFLIGSMTDIATLRTRERQLQAANAKAKAVTEDFQNIISSVDVGLVVLDSNLVIEIMNPAAKRLWSSGDDGWMEHAIGMPFRKVLEHYNSLGFYNLENSDFETFVKSRLSEITTTRFLPREHVINDGTVFLYSSIRLSDGRFLLCYVDITKSKKLDHEVAKAHAEVKKALRLVRNATDTMPQGMMVIEGETITFANETLHHLLELPADFCEPGSSWSKLFYATTLTDGADGSQNVEDQVERFANALAEQRELNYAFPLRGNRWIQLQSRHNEDGHTVILFTDLTDVIARERELKTLVQRAEDADRAKSEFLANMSHEIRTPMNGILGMAELLSKTLLDVRQKTFIDIIEKSGNSLMTIINDILDFSKLDAGQVTLRNAPFDPGEAVKDVASLLAARAADKNIELIVRRYSTLPELVMGDAGRFRQIIINLIGNAVKFTERGHVQVSIRSMATDDGQVDVEVVVEDTGIGIPADKLSQVFEKFSQVDGSSTRRHEGTGLGLSITAGLVKLHSGTIHVDSVAGKGSVFTVKLPMVVARSRAKSRPIPRHVFGARILVVDDNNASRLMLTETMLEWGFDAVAVESGQAALDVLDSADAAGLMVDAILLDYQLTEENGADVARLIRADARFDKLAIILLTTVETTCDQSVYNGLDIAAQLMKPVRSGLLRDALIDIVGTNRPARTTARHVMPTPPDSSGKSSGGHQEVNPVIGLLPVEFDAVSELDVLVAEDNEVNQIVFRQILQGSGLKYGIVDNGLSAIETWQSQRPKIILMDVSMPIMDGLAATRHIREMEDTETGRVIIIGVTAHALDSDIHNCLQAGMDDFLSKPISPDKLEEKVRSWLGNRQSDVGNSG